MTEFKLSDKIADLQRESGTTIQTKYVKEFIEIIERDLENWKGNLTPQIVREIIENRTGDLKC